MAEKKDYYPSTKIPRTKVKFGAGLRLKLRNLIAYYSAQDLVRGKRSFGVCRGR